MTILHSRYCHLLWISECICVYSCVFECILQSLRYKLWKKIIMQSMSVVLLPKRLFSCKNLLYPMFIEQRRDNSCLWSAGNDFVLCLNEGVQTKPFVSAALLDKKKRLIFTMIFIFTHEGSLRTLARSEECHPLY